jgi:cyanophycinase
MTGASLTRRAACVLAVAAIVSTACAPLQSPASFAPSAANGPRNGTLVIAGGGDLTGTGIVERFIETAGGPSAPIVVIPTAAGDPTFGPDWNGLAILRRAGATNVTILHTYDPAEADSEEFVALLRDAAGVWFPGGRQWRLADAYLGTRTQAELVRVLDRGGVIGGSSAGASIQASFLVRGAPEGNHIVMSDTHQRGFGFLQNAAIDQHLTARGRENDLLQILDVNPELLGIGIDEGTAIVVRGDSFEVIGRQRVAVYDGTPLVGSAGYYFLSAGERYDMQSRTPLVMAAEE